MLRACSGKKQKGAEATLATSKNESKNRKLRPCAAYTLETNIVLKGPVRGSDSPEPELDLSEPEPMVRFTVQHNP